MTIRQIIELVDQGKENAIEAAMKVRWIAELDGKIAADVFQMGYSELQQFNYTEAEHMDAEPLVSFPHDDIYRLWLMAMIDLANGEYKIYQNTMQAYNESYGVFARWFARVWQPAQGGSGCYCVNENTPQYYITAYGLAVKLGFVGTVEEWLASLKGEKGDMGDITPELEQLRQDVIAEKAAAVAAVEAAAKKATEAVQKETGIAADHSAAAQQAAAQAEQARQEMEGMVDGVRFEATDDGSGIITLAFTNDNTLPLWEGGSY